MAEQTPPTLTSKTSLLPKILTPQQVHELNTLLQENKLPPVSDNPANIDPEYWHERWKLGLDTRVDPLFDRTGLQLNQEFVLTVSAALAANLAHVETVLFEGSKMSLESAEKAVQKLQQFRVTEQHNVAMCLSGLTRVCIALHFQKHLSALDPDFPLASDIADNLLLECAARVVSTLNETYLKEASQRNRRLIESAFNDVNPGEMQTARLNVFPSITTALAGLAVIGYHLMSPQGTFRRQDEERTIEHLWMDALENAGIEGERRPKLDPAEFIRDLHVLAQRIAYIYLADRNESPVRIASFKTRATGMVMRMKDELDRMLAALPPVEVDENKWPRTGLIEAASQVTSFGESILEALTLLEERLGRR